MNALTPKSLFTVICIEINKTMQDMDAKFLKLGNHYSFDGKDLADKVLFNREKWRVCVVAKVG